ncbi:multicopper oxidase [Fusarium phyllophilum]|uniref:Multicopper oxidase n=1 Tax=Fusarium phyllophilum TaxID=47803 RepID=A0A8H5JWV6_9HYPO|nr:multicopper oxidase [Fusarium phyllophilum]
MLLFWLLLLPLFLLGPHALKHEKVFNLTLTWEAHAPDGFKRDMILVNGRFPGPLIELTEGDDIQVIVHNEMPFNTTIHFHEGRSYPPISNGDRYSVLIKPDRVGNYTLRVTSVAATQIVSGYAITSIRQGHGDSGTSNDTSVPTQYIRDNGISTSPEVAIFNESLAKPFPPSPIPRKADAFYKLEMQSFGSSLYWVIDKTPLHPAQYEHLESPILFDKYTSHSLKNHSISTKTGQWVDLVFTSKVFPMPPHPLHKHGIKLRLLGKGTGKWIWDSVAEAAAAMPEAFNLVDPPRRDAFSSPNAGDEPVWLAVRGMSFIIEDGVDDWPKTPDYYLQTSRKNDECSGRY